MEITEVQVKLVGDTTDRLKASCSITIDGEFVIRDVKVIEGTRERVQNFEGVVIARSNRGMGSNFTVRKMSFGEGVERVFPLYSPNLDSIKVVRKGKVRRAKLYYLRDRRGKSARIAERVDAKPAYDRDGDTNEIYAIACGGSIFTFIRTSAGFQLTDVCPCLGQ